VGLSSGLLSFIPYVGTVTGCITSLALASAQFQSWTGVGLVAGVFVLGQALEGYVIYPRFLGDRVESSVVTANVVWKKTRASVETTVRSYADTAVAIVRHSLPKIVQKAPAAPKAKAVRARRSKAVKRAKHAAKAKTKR
jgi:hypothetical protein